MIHGKFLLREIPHVTFVEKFDSCMGALIINGLTLPNGRSLDPLGELWSHGLRKRIYETFELDVAGLFVYDDEKEVISCSFYPNFTIPEVKGTSPKMYMEKFMDTFPRQMLMWEEAIEAFLYDQQNGYLAYCELANKGDTEVKAMLHRFLRSKNLRTKQDIERSKKKQAKLKQAIERSGASPKPQKTSSKPEE